MAKLLLLEPIGGIAGDMFLAAALDLGVPLAELERPLRSLGLEGWRFEVSRAEVNGIGGTHVAVRDERPQPVHRHLADILSLIAASGLSPKSRDAASAVFDRIGRAEAKVHSIPLDEVHFHEVGAVDSIVDICGAAVALEQLGWPRLFAAIPELGQGAVRTAHGVLPVPPPAVLEILRGLPVRFSGPRGEAVTPTGAALLAVLAELGELPPIVVERVGYGIGTARWADRPNLLRLTYGEARTSKSSTAAGEGAPAGRMAELCVIEANLDDCPGQLVARAIEQALGNGALDAWATPITMKKGRPGLILGALAPKERCQSVMRTFLAETTTLGVRVHPVDRVELDRRWVAVETPYGAVRVKVGSDGDRILGAHPEYDDCVARATEHGVPVKEVMAAALAAYCTR